MKSIVENLAASKFFQGLSQQHLESLAALAHAKVVPKGGFLMQESQEGSHLYLLCRGRVEVTVTIPGGKGTETIATLQENDLVGELTLFGKKRRSANVVAKDNLEVLEWDAKAMLECFENNYELGYHFMRQLAVILAERLLSTNQVLRNALSLPAPFF